MHVSLTLLCVHADLAHGADFISIDSLTKVRMFMGQTPEFSHSLAGEMAKAGWIF